jgi:hypothetical protein
MKTLGVLILGVTLAAPAFAQTAPRPLDARQTHYQIGVMERVLEGAVEHGAVNLRERLQAVFPDAPAQLLILDTPRVRGFRLDGYGVFFDVEVPSLNGTLTWTLRTLDPNAPLAAQGAAAPVPASTAAPILPNPRRAAGTATGTPDRAVAATSVSPKAAQNNGSVAVAPVPDDRILENPNEEYRGEVVQALADAMLDYSGPLAIGADEWLTIAARGIQDRPRLGPPDNDVQTVVIRLRGADLAAFRAGQIAREEVIRRIDKRVF